jgi:hypothetical protein
MYFSMASCQRTASMRLPPHHRLGRAAEQRRHVLAVVLDDDLHLLGDVVRVEPHPAHDLLQGRAALDLLVVELLALVGELEGEAVGRVVLQHVEDELLLDGLAHRVDVERRGTLSAAGLRDGSGRVPNSSIVLFLGVAVNATKVMPVSSARAAICAPGCLRC